MTENKLWKIIAEFDEEFIILYGGYTYLITNGNCVFYVWESKEDVQKICAMLNEIIQENEQLKQQLKNKEKAHTRCDELYWKLYDENEQLKKENNKIKTLLFQKIKELNDSYQKGAKAGMPTGGIIGELDLLEEICEEMRWSTVSSLGVTSTLMYYDKGEKND